MRRSELLTKKRNRILAFAVLLVFSACLLPVMAAAETAEDIPTDERGWVDFFLMCNEGMGNDGGNVGNTMMIVSMNPQTGKIRMMMFTWDTFIQYPGYDLPQKIDQPYRNNGPEETMRVFDANFHMDISLYMSLNYLNLANLIDDYGGVTIENLEIAERNALNDMVNSKKENILDMAGRGILSQLVVEKLAQDYYLNDFGPDTHLNGLQAVGYGWLQYDSVYNCCNREKNVIAALFSSVGKDLREKVVLYTNAAGEPENLAGRRPINLDAMTEEDISYLLEQMEPIFQKSSHNLTDKDIRSITLALTQSAYLASRQGVSIFDSLDVRIFPLEAKNPYDNVAGTLGHLIDYAKNEEEMKAFLFAD